MGGDGTGETGGAGIGDEGVETFAEDGTGESVGEGAEGDDAGAAGETGITGTGDFMEQAFSKFGRDLFKFSSSVLKSTDRILLPMRLISGEELR